MTQTNSSIGIRQLLDMQKQAFIEEAAVSADVRMQRIQQVIDMLVENKDALCSAMGEDFGGRHPVSTLTMDVQTPIGHLKYAKKNVARWMRPQRRAISKRARADIESAPTSSVCPYFVSRAKDRELF